MDTGFFSKSIACLIVFITGFLYQPGFAHLKDIDQPNDQCRQENPIYASSSFHQSIYSSSNSYTENYGFLGQIGGKHSGIAVYGNYAYVGFGSIIKIFDISKIYSPHLVGIVDSNGETIRSIFIGGDYAYIVDEFSNARVFNLLDPINPIDITPSPFISAIEIQIIGNLAYVGDGYDFYIYQINSPFSLTQLSVVHKPGIVWSFDIQGDYAYLAISGVGLSILNVNNPQAPEEVGFYPTTYVSDVTVSGDYAFIAAY